MRPNLRPLALLIDGSHYATVIVNVVDGEAVFDIPVNAERGALRGRIGAATFAVATFAEAWARADEIGAIVPTSADYGSGVTICRLHEATVA